MAVTVATAAPAAPGHATAVTAVTTTKHIMPNKTSRVDCNGLSPKYKSVTIAKRDLCVDPRGRGANGKATRFYDNGKYVGHDEPSVKFISTARNSANTFSTAIKIPVDPKRSPTPSGSVTDYANLSVAPWIGLPMCDNASYPQNPCTPDSNSNQNGGVNNPASAGSAFMELQFYPPGYTPFIDSTSCSVTKWCAALTIDSLECSVEFLTCNNNCIEPVNFAYVQTNGVPTGPPSPQLSDASTLLPNGHTLMINQGDALQVSISDPAAGFTVNIRDRTTGQSGFMTASAANGFMQTSMADCSGTPYNFHAEYNSALPQNGVPWAALEGGVLIQNEIGHSEGCSSVANSDPESSSFADGQTFTDNKVFDTCNGGAEPTATGEGPCDSAGACQNAETQGQSGPVACNDNEIGTPGQNCEYSDGPCFQKGTRTAQVDGKNVTESAASNQCWQTRTQNGDLDFDGLDYQSFTWPDGTANHPTPFQFTGPFDSGGKLYPQLEFETDAAGSENLCNTGDGQGCTAPPIGSHAYPYWTLNKGGGTLSAGGRSCSWSLGQTTRTTVSNFGKDLQYGSPDAPWFFGTLISQPEANPMAARACQV